MVPLRGIFFVVLLCIVGQICCSDDSCCEDLRCWEKCFEEPTDPVWRNAFNQIYKIIDGIRGLYSPCSRPRGTCFSLDSTVHAANGLTGAQMMEFERNLAAIIALTQPVSNKHNPFFLNKFYQTFTWAADQDWQCKENCEAAAQLLSSPVQHHVQELIPGTSGLRYYGCYLCRYQFDGRFQSGRCHDNVERGKELMIAIVNSNFDDAPPADWPCNTMNRVIIGTDPATDLNTMNEWSVKPAPPFGSFWASGLSYQIPVNNVNLIATKTLLKCMQKKCCSNAFTSIGRRDLRKTQTYGYMDKNSGCENGSENCSPKLKKFSGTFDEFSKNVLAPNDDSITKCRTDTDCPQANVPYVCRNRICVIEIGEEIGDPVLGGVKPVKGRQLSGEDDDVTLTEEPFGESEE